MRRYFDSAYIAKCYVREPDALAVRTLARQAASGVYSSALCIAEVACVFHRQVREGRLTAVYAAEVIHNFRDDLANDIWTLLPLSTALLRQVDVEMSKLPAHLSLRAGDAIHLVSALDAGFTEIWTNDRHMLAAAPHFGLTGRSVTA